MIVKCFNSSKGRKTSLDFNKIFKDSDDLLSLYEKVLNIRNKHIAHSGDYMNSLVLYLDPTTNYPIDLRYSHIKRLTGEQIISYDKLNQLINYILKEVSIIKEKLYLKLNDELKKNGASHYYKISKSIDKSTIVSTVEIDGKMIAKSFHEKKKPISKA